MAECVDCVGIARICEPKWSKSDLGKLRRTAPENLIMACKTRVLILDDDELALALLKMKLGVAFPDMDIETTTDPAAVGTHDIFLIDNEFDGVVLGPTLGREARRLNPEALIVAFSSTLDTVALKGLLNAGCDGACDKSDPEDFDRLVAIMRNYAACMRSRARGIGGVMRSMVDLLRLWNGRLDKWEPV